MLGRLIDQLFPQHVHEPSEAKIAHSFLSSHPNLKNYGPEAPWGDVLPLLRRSDLNLINLETSATTSAKKWPDKVFNYRMHPANIEALKAAKVDYAGLANNHTLDFSEEGLVETVRTVRGAGIAFAGAGESEEEAVRPAVMRLPGGKEGEEYEVHVWAASDHPSDWARVKGFHFIDYTRATRERLQTLLTRPADPEESSSTSKQSDETPTSSPPLKIFSVHWGPNYSWQPARELRDLAHFLIDSCDIDIVHGHSSHHVQGVEKYRGKLIIYGCGDFVDDYALVPDFRNDLSGVWSVVVEEGESGGEGGGGGLKLKRLEVHPTKCEPFVTRLLRPEEPDSQWVRERIRLLSAEMGTDVKLEAVGAGRAVVDLS